MYDNPVSPGAGAALGLGTLAVTGVNILWLIIAGIALIGAGFAIDRFVPRKEE